MMKNGKNQESTGSQSNESSCTLVMCNDRRPDNNDQSILSPERPIPEGCIPVSVVQELLSVLKDKYQCMINKRIDERINKVNRDLIDQIKWQKDDYQRRLQEDSNEIKEYMDRQQQIHISEIKKLYKTLDATEKSLALLQSRYNMLFYADIVRRHFMLWKRGMLGNCSGSTHCHTASCTHIQTGEASHMTRECFNNINIISPADGHYSTEKRDVQQPTTIGVTEAVDIHIDDNKNSKDIKPLMEPPSSTETSFNISINKSISKIRSSEPKVSEILKAVLVSSYISEGVIFRSELDRCISSSNKCSNGGPLVSIPTDIVVVSGSVRECQYDVGVRTMSNGIVGALPSNFSDITQTFSDRSSSSVMRTCLSPCLSMEVDESSAAAFVTLFELQEQRNAQHDNKSLNNGCVTNNNTSLSFASEERAGQDHIVESDNGGKLYIHNNNNSNNGDVTKNKYKEYGSDSLLAKLKGTAEIATNMILQRRRTRETKEKTKTKQTDKTMKDSEGASANARMYNQGDSNSYTLSNASIDVSHSLLSSLIVSSNSNSIVSFTDMPCASEKEKVCLKDSVVTVSLNVIPSAGASIPRWTAT